MSNWFEIEMDENDADADTLGDYFVQLLLTLWMEGEGFSGKRPFGNSGWDYEVYATMIKAGLVNGKLDEEGFVEEVDTVAANKLVSEFILGLGSSHKGKAA